MEMYISDITSGDKSYTGCKRNGRDIMISYYHNNEFTDLFLTQECAQRLHDRLSRSLQYNLDNPDEDNDTQFLSTIK